MYGTTTVVIAFLVSLVQASALSTRTLLALHDRQSVDPGDTDWGSCTSLCQPWSDQTNVCDAEPETQAQACICNNKYLQMMGSCYNCIIEEEASFASDAQTIVNKIVSGCTQNGFAVTAPSLEDGTDTSGSGTTGSSAPKKATGGAASLSGLSNWGVAGVVVGVAVIAFA